MVGTLANFPTGISPTGLGGDVAFLTSGRIFFVNSATGKNTNVGRNGQSPDRPFATLAYAITQVRNSKGDIIYLQEGHAETIAAATSLALNKIGVRIIGLGFRSNRPTITFNGTASVIAISGASTLLQNVVLLAGIDEVVKAISVTAAFVTLDGVDVVETTSKQFIQFCLTSAAATDLTIQNCLHFQGTAPAANTLWIQLVAAHRALIQNNIFQVTTTNSASSSIISATTAATQVTLKDNIIVQLGGTATIPINMVAASSGFALRNTVASAKTAIAGSIALASLYGALNYAGHVVNTNGLLEPVVDS